MQDAQSKMHKVRCTKSIWGRQKAARIAIIVADHHGTVTVAREKLSRHTSPDLHDAGHALVAYLQTVRKEVLRKKNAPRIRLKRLRGA